MRLMIGLVLVLLASPVQAQPTVQLWADYGNRVASMIFVDGYEPVFDVVVTVAAGEHEMAGLDFSVTGMPPGVFMLGEEYPDPTTVNLEAEGTGRYRLRLSACDSPCELREVLRVTWGAFAAFPPADTIIEVAGLDEPNPLLVDCQGVGHTAPMGGHAGGISGTRVVLPPGGLMLNPGPPCVLVRPYCGFDYAVRIPCGLAIEAETRSLTTLKSRFMK